MNNISFTDLIKEGQIRIPQIQRDYAQGRCNKTVDEIRDNFVRSLMMVVMGKKQEVQLDFVYGSKRDGAFEPLDGQQRLTTLFLLHWVLGVNLKNIKGESCLTYETRNTSKAFCNELMAHDAKQFVNEAKLETTSSKKVTVSEIIRERDWFQWAWQFDPTICSMLVMIDTICEQFDWNLNLEECQRRLINIKFNYLDLGQLDMSDELFIKMNARGKLLSDFDKLKSTLEEEIQQQQEEKNNQGEKLSNTEIETDWRKYMDGKWMDLFWQKYAKDILSKQSGKERLNVAKATERRFRIFLLRMIGIQLFAKIKNVEKIAKDSDDGKILANFNKLKEATYKNNESDLNDLLLAYQNQLTDWRSEPGNDIKPDYCLTIDFKQLIEFINLWIIPKDKEYTEYKDVTSLLSKEAYFNNSNLSYFDLFTDEKLSYDVTAIIYAMMLFLKRFQYEDKDEWKCNFETWMRIVRNVFNNDNNTDRFNSYQDLANAFDGIEKLVGEMAQRNLSVNTDKAAVLLFIKSITIKSITNTDTDTEAYKGVNNQSLQEEIDKAKLRLTDNEEINKEWTEAILEAEKDPYLWGQIRCIIHWAEGDLDKFNMYASHLIKWINTDKDEDKQLYYTAMLCFRPNCWKRNNRLYEFNKDRDNSLKRYLRDEPYGQYVKDFIDEWITWNSNASFLDFCKHIITSTNPTGWIKYFCEYPEIIWESRRKRIFEDKGHVIFAQQKTTDSHCFDPIFLYLRKHTEKTFYDENKKQMLDGVFVKLFDSKSVNSHGLEVSIREKTLYICWGENESKYKLEVKEGTDTKELFDCNLDDAVLLFINKIEELANRLI